MPRTCSRSQKSKTFNTSLQTNKVVQLNIAKTKTKQLGRGNRVESRVLACLIVWIMVVVAEERWLG